MIEISISRKKKYQFQIITSIDEGQVHKLVKRFTSDMKEILVYERVREAISNFCANNSIDEVNQKCQLWPCGSNHCFWKIYSIIGLQHKIFGHYGLCKRKFSGRIAKICAKWASIVERFHTKTGRTTSYCCKLPSGKVTILRSHSNKVRT